MSKSKKEIINELKDELSNIENLYDSDCVKRIGKTKDTDEYYSEIVASELLQELIGFDKISTVTRTKTYCRENHKKIKIDLESNRDEENFAKRITGLKLDGLGLIKDFQIPLKDTRANKGLGKIDLISFNEETKILFLIELKYEENKETLLRAILESYTYYKIIDKTKLINDCFNDDINLGDINVKPAVLVVPDCNAYKELQEIKNGKRLKLKELINKLNISCFVGKFEVEIENTEK